MLIMLSLVDSSIGSIIPAPSRQPTINNKKYFLVHLYFKSKHSNFAVTKLDYKMNNIATPVKDFLVPFVSSQLPAINSADSLAPVELLEQPPEQLIISTVLGIIGLFLNQLFENLRRKRASKQARKNTDAINKL